MPKQLGSAVMFTIFLVAIAVAANRAEENTNRPDQTRGARGPASVSPDVMGEAEPTPFRHTAKLHGPVNVSIDLVGEPPAHAGDVFTLRGRISSEQPLAQVEYRWSLPAGVELVNGLPRGEISRLDAQTSQVVELTLRAKSSTNQQVHLLTTARAHGARFAESAQFNTVDQAAFAASRLRLRKSTAAAEKTARALKVMH